MRVQDDEVIETITTDEADEPFEVGILPRRTRGNEYFLNAKVAYTALKPFAINSVTEILCGVCHEPL